MSHLIAVLALAVLGLAFWRGSHPPRLYDDAELYD